MTATLVDFFSKNSATQVFISDGIRQLDASEAFVNSARCFNGSVPDGIWLWNARRDLYALYAPNARGEVQVPLRAEIVLTCPTPTYTGFMESHHPMLIEATFKKSVSGKYEFSSEQLQAFPVSCEGAQIVDCH